MFCLSNKFPENFILPLQSFFYNKISYRNTFFIRKVYRNFVNIPVSLTKLIKFGTADIFDAVTIETTTYCNRKCAYCPNSIFDREKVLNKKIMQEELFRKIIDELKEINFDGKIYPHLYGEPLCDLRLPELMAYAHRQLPKANIVVYTNADFLDSKMLNTLYDSGVCSYVITLHGDKERGVEKIKSLFKYIKSSGKNIRILCQVMNKNTPLSNVGGLVKVNNQYVEALDCINPLTINCNGDVLICCNDYLGKTSFGNISKEKLMSIWSNSKFVNVRKEIGKKKYNLEICKRCLKQK